MRGHAYVEEHEEVCEPGVGHIEQVGDGEYEREEAAVHEAVSMELHPEDHVKVAEQCPHHAPEERCHVRVGERLSEVMDGQKNVDDDGEG